MVEDPPITPCTLVTFGTARDPRHALHQEKITECSPTNLMSQVSKPVAAAPYLSSIFSFDFRHTCGRFVRRIRFFDFFLLFWFKRL